MTSTRPFSSTPISPKGISPESENPQPTPKEPTAGAPKPAGISAEVYDELSNVYMDRIVEKLEHLQEEKEGVDVEYSVCALPLYSTNEIEMLTNLPICRLECSH
jgi:frataxin